MNKDNIEKWFVDHADVVISSLNSGIINNKDVAALFQLFYALGVLDHASYSEEAKREMLAVIKEHLPVINTRKDLH